MDRELLLPTDFGDYAWEIEAKGVCWEVSVRVGDRLVAVTFYDPVRLAQDIAAELRGGAYPELRRVLVVPRVTAEQMRAAIARVPREFFA
ncbi:hypothetical protein [Buchananella hordeovulneris]|uniref:Uncharacterized protein n=1 Tax=Buchananella hordeovulneris TaxID=52770 RepID=A0A1Q5PWS8_9ACTO|nr:hypothetical protein [Buchananella hordeovulneris]MDO5079765.1 hypothetical protein [Buchananella hordeovulneris]OKL51875.1 hypothetical protein BSZ40_05145 [Buchananella hordeovulneris]